MSLGTAKLLTGNTEYGYVSSKDVYPKPLSLGWRICHSSAYMVGGSTFLVGSLQYFPIINQLVLGGWLFTIGSAGFLFADALEWWTNNRVGCFAYDAYEESFEAVMGDRFSDKRTCAGRYQRAENGLNFFTSMMGSLLYLIGSIMFIPSLAAIVTGSYVFLYGSAFIFIAQSWKLYRAACFNEETRDKRFQITNWKQDLPGFLVDLFAGLGGGAYFVGSFVFLPQYDLNDHDTNIAAGWFTCGGTCFFLSAVCMWYRYYCTLNYPHEKKHADHLGDL